MNTNCSFYEWLYEPVDMHEDIIDVCHQNKLSDCFPIPKPEDFGDNCIRVDIALRLRIYRHEDLDEQYYNYLYKKPNGCFEIDSFFNDAFGSSDRKVPKRFFRELERFNRLIMKEQDNAK